MTAESRVRAAELLALEFQPPHTQLTHNSTPVALIWQLRSKVPPCLRKLPAPRAESLCPFPIPQAADSSGAQNLTAEPPWLTYLST